MSIFHPNHYRPALLFSVFIFSSHTEYVRRESIIIVKKKSLLLMNVYVLYVLEDKTGKKNSVRLSVC